MDFIKVELVSPRRLQSIFLCPACYFIWQTGMPLYERALYRCFNLNKHQLKYSFLDYTLLITSLSPLALEDTETQVFFYSSFVSAVFKVHSKIV